MKPIELKCSQCNSWNIDIVHSVFSYYICRDCEACYEEHTMKPLHQMEATFNLDGKEYTHVFTIDEIKQINDFETLRAIIKRKYERNKNYY